MSRSVFTHYPGYVLTVGFYPLFQKVAGYKRKELYDLWIQWFIEYTGFLLGIPPLNF